MLSTKHLQKITISCVGNDDDAKLCWQDIKSFCAFEHFDNV